MSALCRSERCKAEILWCENEATGKRIPLDPAPNPEGRWVKVRVEFRPSDEGKPDKKFKIVRRLRRDEDPPEGHGTYTSHYETCPDPDKFSKGRKQK